MNIVFLEPLGLCGCKAEALKNKFKTEGHNVYIHFERNENEEEIIKRGKDADIIAVSNIPITKNIIDACPNLKMISVAFTGVDHINMEVCREREIIVSNAAGFSTEAVAELTIGMIISTYRKIAGGDSITRMGGSRMDFLGTELNGKTIGIIGTGAIGQRVAELARAFKCKVLGHCRNPKKIEGIEFTDKETLLKNSDIISLHVPLTAETRNMIGEKEFNMMKSDAILINTARGPVVDKEALCEALSSHKISGAALDVYDIEPPLPSDHILFKAPNLLMLPHIAYATNESFAKRLEIVIENILLWLEGKPRNIMN